MAQEVFDNIFFRGGVILSASVSPPFLTANTNNLLITGLVNASIIYIGATSNRDLTGIDSTGISDGQTYIMYNVSSNNVKLKNNNAGSLVQNRFILDADVTLQKGMGVILTYRALEQRWRVATVV